jgi:hypothetical protein
MKSKNSIEDLSSQAISAYQQAISELLGKVSPGSFRIVELKRRTLKVQLETFLDDSALFKELQDCSLNWEKLMFDENYRIRRGWVFEWVWEPDLLLKMLEHKSKGIELVEADAVVSTEPLQFLKNQELWVGIPIPKFGLPPHHSSWKLMYDQRLYWVENADKLINEWLIQAFKPSSFYSPMLDSLSWHKMPEWLEKLGLKDYFSQWVRTRLKDARVEKPKQYHSGWHTSHWEHPADQWLNFYAQFPQNAAFNSILGDGFSIVVAVASLIIQELKQEAARKARDEARQGAIPKAKQLVADRSWTKIKLQELAQEFEIGFKKTDSKSILISALLEGDKAQLIAEKILEIPND